MVIDSKEIASVKHIRLDKNTLMKVMFLNYSNYKLMMFCLLNLYLFGVKMNPLS